MDLPGPYGREWLLLKLRQAQGKVGENPKSRTCLHSLEGDVAIEQPGDHEWVVEEIHFVQQRVWQAWQG